jgi:hypothetical protein
LTHRIDQLGAVAQQQSPGSVQHHRGLLRDRLDRHKAHVGANYRLADPFGIGRIVLVGLDEGADVLRRDQSDVVAQTAKFTRPMMTARACLDPDQSFGQSGKERDDLGAAKPPTQHAPSLGIGAVHLEDVLGDVEADYGRIGHVTS